MAFCLFIIYTISFFLHFSSRIPALGQIRFDFLLMIFLIIFIIIKITDQNDIFKTPISNALLVFFVCCILSIPIVKWPGSVINHGLKEFIKGTVFFFCIICFVNDRKKLKIFLTIFLFCQIFRAFEPAYLHYTQGYWGDAAFIDASVGQVNMLDRLAGAPNDVINPNQLAWVINTTFPFIYFFGFQHKKKMVQLCSFALAGLLLYPLLLTGSRSGIVCVFAIVVGIILMSPNKFKRLAIFFFIGCPIALMVTHMLSPQMAERYLSLIDSNAAGASTVSGRIDGIIDCFSTITNFHGIFGHGLGTSLEVNVHYLGSALYAHNLYIEALQEVGIVGLILFSRYAYKLILGLKSFDFEHSDSFFMEQLVKALKVWIFMDLIYSFSCFGLNSWEWYLFGGITAVCVQINHTTAIQSNFSLA